MAKTRAQKNSVVDQYKQKLKGAKFIVVIEPKGLNPNELNEFRKLIFDFGSSLNIVKNTLFRVALKEEKLPEIKDLDSKEHAVLFCKEDFVGPLKALKKFIEDTKFQKEPRVKVVVGMLDGQVIPREQVLELSNMPSFEGSIAQILGILDMAVSGVANVLEDSVRSYVSILDQAYTKQD